MNQKMKNLRPRWAKRKFSDVGIVWRHCRGYWKLYYDQENDCFRCPVCHRILMALTPNAIPRGETNT